MNLLEYVAIGISLILLLIIILLILYLVCRRRRSKKFKPNKRRRRQMNEAIQVNAAKTNVFPKDFSPLLENGTGPHPTAPLNLVMAPTTPAAGRLKQPLATTTQKMGQGNTPESKTPNNSSSSNAVSSRRQWQKRLMTCHEAQPQMKAESKDGTAEILESNFAHYQPLIGEGSVVKLNCSKYALETDYPLAKEADTSQLREKKHTILKEYKLDAKSARNKGIRAKFGTPSKSVGSSGPGITSTQSVELTTTT